MAQERDYIFGTQDAEIARLGLQHRVWRARALDAWRRAGFRTGQTLMDVGCGPGFASLDLAELVGAGGRVVAIDRSPKFLDTLRATARARGLEHVETHQVELDRGPFPKVAVDGAWIRWVLAFVPQPRLVLEWLASALKPGAALVVHEYAHYASWRFAPRSPALDDFVRIVMQSWRADGGEPDVGLDLPGWLEELGLEIRSLRPIVDAIRPADHAWEWPQSFLDIGIQRLGELGMLDAKRGAEIAAAYAEVERSPHALCLTPTVLEIIARKP